MRDTAKIASNLEGMLREHYNRGKAQAIAIRAAEIHIDRIQGLTCNGKIEDLRNYMGPKFEEIFPGLAR